MSYPAIQHQRDLHWGIGRLLHITQRFTLHPHCHSIVSDGVFRPDGSFQPLPPLDSQQLMWLFRHKLLQELLRLGKIYPATIEILDRFRHTGFSVYQGPPGLPGDTAAREKLAVYIALRYRSTACPTMAPTVR